MRPPGDPAVDRAFERAADLAAAGDLTGARAHLRRLADSAGSPHDSARALRLAAALSRVLGEPGTAAGLARTAVERASGDDDLAAGALDELGEALVGGGDPAGAADAFGRAAGLVAGRRAVVLRLKRGYALSTAGRADEAAAQFTALADAAPDPRERAAILLDAATAGALPIERDAIRAAGSPVLNADLALVDAARALQDRDLDRALAAVRHGRRYALDAVAPVQYVAAAVAESALAALAGDDAAAYASLATGYATLADLVGKPLSAQTFEPPLRDLRTRWGADRFADAKAAYEGRRHR